MLGCQSPPVTQRAIRGAIKASVDGYTGSHFMACQSVAAATEIYHAHRDLALERANLRTRPTTAVGRTPLADAPNTSSSPTTSGSRTEEPAGGDSHPMQPFALDESVSSLTDHECYWVTWVAVRPGVYFGM